MAFFRNIEPTAITDGYVTYASIWFGAVLIFFFYIIPLIFIFYVGSKILNVCGYKKIKLHRSFGVALVLVWILLNVYGVYHSFQLRITSYMYDITQNKGLVNSFENFDIEDVHVIAIADTHIGAIRGKKSFTKVVETIEAMQSPPDFIFLIGDIFDGVKIKESDFLPLLHRITSLAPTYYVNGNHEAWQNPYFESIIKKSKITLLSDEVVDVGVVQLAGLEYIDSRQTSKKDQYTALKKAIKKVSSQTIKPTIYIKHTPDNAETIQEDKNAFLSIFGHTHNGQMFPYMYAVRSRYGEYRYGLFKPQGKDNYFTSITTSGAGTWGPPQRIGTQTEIVSIILKKK
ncbi:MAG: metallophosphoesterase [Alphaproteobacteria bacterium]|nr:metallophosphoesterase [Alphaproteobacteria bacterium]